MANLKVELNHVTFRHGSTPVFTDFSLTFGPGRTLLLGPNGAGKSTLFGLMSGSYRPQSAGRGQRAGTPPGTVELHEGTVTQPLSKAVGIMYQTTLPIPGLNLAEQVTYWGWLNGLSVAEARDRAISSLHNVGLAELADRRASKVSGGELRRVGLAQALVTTPQVLLLDEPTNALDPLERKRLRGILVNQLASVPIVIIATHVVRDFSDLYDTVVVIDHGRVLFNGSGQDFLALDESGHRDPENAYEQLLTEELVVAE